MRLLLIAATLLAACTEESQAPTADAADHLSNAVTQQAAGDAGATIDALKAVLTLDPDLTTARLMLGCIHLESGRGAAAEKELRAALRLGADAVELGNDIAQALFAQAKYGEFIEATRASEDARRWILRGRAQTAMLRGGPAVSSFVGALHTDPLLFEDEIGLARVAITMRDAWLARFHADRALALATENPRTLRLDADLKIAAMDFMGAREAFAGAYAVDPTDTLALVDLLRVTLLLERFDEAGEWLTKLEAELPESNQAAFLHAYLEYQQGELKSAEPQLRVILSRTSPHVQSMYLLAAIQYSMGRVSQADALLSAFLRRNPGYGPASALLETIRSAPAGSEEGGSVAAPPLDQREKLALLGITPLTQDEAQDRSGVRRIAAYYGGLGFVHVAASVIETRLKATPEDVELLNLLAQLLFSQSDPRAAKIAERAHELAPEHAGVLHIYARLLLKAGNTEQALLLLDHAVRNGLDSASVHFHRGLALAEMGEVAAAVEAVQKALIINPGFGDRAHAQELLTTGYEFYWNRGEFAKGISILEHLSGIYPDNPELLNALARAYYVANDPRALGVAERAHVLAPEDSELLHSYGWLLSRNDEPRRVIKILEEAVARGLYSSSLTYHRGATLAKLGQYDKARALIKLALEEGEKFTDRAEAEEPLSRLQQMKSAQETIR